MLVRRRESMAGRSAFGDPGTNGFELDRAEELARKEELTGGLVAASERSAMAAAAPLAAGMLIDIAGCCANDGGDASEASSALMAKNRVAHALRLRLMLESIPCIVGANCPPAGCPEYTNR